MCSKIQTVPFWSLMFRTNVSVKCRGDQYFVLGYLCTQNLTKQPSTLYLATKRGDECKMQNNFGDGSQNTWDRMVLRYRNTLQAQVASINSFKKLKLGFHLTVKMKRTVAVSSLVCLSHYVLKFPFSYAYDLSYRFNETKSLVFSIHLLISYSGFTNSLSMNIKLLKTSIYQVSNVQAIKFSYCTNKTT